MLVLLVFNLIFISMVKLTGVFWVDLMLKNITVLGTTIFVLLKFKLSEDIESMGRKLLSKVGIVQP
jgi:hypothetical protein